MKKLNFSSLTLFMAAFMGMSSISATDTGRTYTLVTTPTAIALPSNASAKAQANWTASAANRSNNNVTFAPLGIDSDEYGNGLYRPHVVNSGKSYTAGGEGQFNSGQTQGSDTNLFYTIS